MPDDAVLEPIGIPEYFADGFGNFRTVNGIFRFVAFTEHLAPGDRIAKIAFQRFYVPVAGAADATERAKMHFSSLPHAAAESVSRRLQN